MDRSTHNPDSGVPRYPCYGLTIRFTCRFGERVFRFLRFIILLNYLYSIIKDETSIIAKIMIKEGKLKKFTFIIKLKSFSLYSLLTGVVQF